MSLPDPAVVFWFRRDLRTSDNHGLWQVVRCSGQPILPLFIFRKCILDPLARDDARIEFIHRTVVDLDQSLSGHLYVEYGEPVDVIVRLIEKHKIFAVYTNKDYEPYARERDGKVADFLKFIKEESI